MLFVMGNEDARDIHVRDLMDISNLLQEDELRLTLAVEGVAYPAARKSLINRFGLELKVPQREPVPGDQVVFTNGKGFVVGMVCRAGG